MDEQHDVVVVGAGVIGLACAWRAAQRGLDVCLLERERPGAGASVVAAGMLVPATEVDFGEEDLVRLKLASAELYAAFAAEVEEASAMPVGYEREGALYVALDRDELEVLGRLFEVQRSLGLEAERLLPSACRELEPGLSPACAGGVFASGDGQVDSRALVDALAVAADRAGVRIVTGAEVTGIVADGVETRDGRYGAGRIVVACGCWSGSAEWLPSEVRPPVRPVKGQLVHLRGAPGALARRPLRTETVYVVPRSDGRVVVGATVEEQGFDVTITAGAVHELLREAYRALPDVAELEFVGAMAGLRPGTPDNGPVIGETAIEGLVLATGHYRSGVLLAPVTAEAVTAMLTGESADPIVSPFAPGRFERLGVS